MSVSLDFLENMPSNSSEMDTRGSYEDEEGEGTDVAELMGLSRASLKKYSSPARKRILARQAKRKAALQASMVGFSLKPPKSLTKAIKKLDVHKVNQLVKTYGPIVATVYPAAAPAVAAATVALNAIDKKDPKALAQLAATQAAAASGNPEAQQAIEMLQVAQNLKSATKAQGILKAAQSGDVTALAKVDAIKLAAASGNPEAAKAMQTFEDVNQGAKNIAKLKVQKQAASAAALAPLVPQFSARLPESTESRKAQCECE